jgi:hypothetical protein
MSEKVAISISLAFVTVIGTFAVQAQEKVSRVFNIVLCQTPAAIEDVFQRQIFKGEMPEEVAVANVNRQCGFEVCQKRPWLIDTQEEIRSLFGLEQIAVYRFVVKGTVRTEPDGTLMLDRQRDLKYGIRGRVQKR